MNNKFFYVVIILCTMSTSNASFWAYMGAIGSAAKSFLGYEEERSAQTQSDDHKETLKKQLDASNEHIKRLVNNSNAATQCADQIGKLGEINKETGSVVAGQLGQMVDAHQETNAAITKGLGSMETLKQGLLVWSSISVAKDVLATGYSVITGTRKWLLPTAKEKAQSEAEDQDAFNVLAAVKIRAEFTKCMLDNREAATAANGVPEACKSSHVLYAALSNRKSS